MRLLAWLSIAGLAAYLLYLGGGWWGIYAAPVRLFSIAVAGAVLGAWAFVARRNPAWQPKSVMWPAIAACLVSLGISTVFSRVPRVSVEYVGYAVLLSGLYLLLVRLFAHDFFQRRLVVLATVLFWFTAGAYLVGVVAQWIQFWVLVGRVTLPPLRPAYEGLAYGNPSAALTVVALLAVPAVAFTGVSTRLRVAIVLAVGAVVAVVALLTGSRAGWLALAITVVVTPAVWLLAAENRRAVRTRLTEAGRRWMGAAAVGAGVLVVLLIVFGPAIARRVGAGGDDLRLTFAATALRMFTLSPLFGTGPGTWVILRSSQTLPSEPDYYVPHAHDVPVQTLAELGLVGALAGVLLVANLAWLLVGAIRGEDHGRRAWAWLTLAGLVYFALHQLLDFYANLPGLLFAAALPVAYLDATSSTTLPLRVSVPLRLQRAAPALAGAVIVVALIGLAAQEVPALENERAVQSANAGSWAGALEPARAASAQDPEVGTYQLVAGLAESNAGNHQAAADHFARVASRDDLPEAWLDLAAEQAALGQSDAALTSVEASLRLGLQRPAVAMPAGDLALRFGDEQTAIEAFAAALALSPSLAGDPWWHIDPKVEQAFDQGLDRALGSVDAGTRWQLLLMAGRTDEAAALVSATAVEKDIVSAWSGDPPAIERLFARCDSQPLVPEVQVWCARVAEHAGRTTLAQHYRDVADVAGNGVGRLGAELRVTTAGPGPFDGSPASFWGTYTYRRPTSLEILVPDLIHLVSR